MDFGKDVTKVWQRLGVYVTTDSQTECRKIEVEGGAIANRLHDAQVGLAEAVYGREWNDEWAPILSLLIPGTRSGGLSGCRFEHPDEHSNGPMSSLRLRMNSLGINVVQNGPSECMIETAWYCMSKAERLFLEKGHWHIEWKLTAIAKENVVHDLVNVYDWIMLPASVGEKFFRNGTIDLSKFPCHQLNGSFCALSAMRKSLQYCQGCFDENADYEGVVFVVRRRSKNEAQRKWVTASNGKQKLDNYFNREFTDHISAQNGYLENDDEHVGVANLPKKWVWNVPDDSSQMSMGITRMPQNESMMRRPHGHPLLCLAEMAEWNRLATVRPNGLIEWRLMGHTMVPLTQAGAAGLHHDCSTWDELYEDDDGELVNAWNGPIPSNAAMPSKKAKTMASSSSATALANVANALNPGAEVVLRMNANAKAK